MAGEHDPAGTMTYVEDRPDYRMSLPRAASAVTSVTINYWRQSDRVMDDDDYWMEDGGLAVRIAPTFLWDLDYEYGDRVTIVYTPVLRERRAHQGADRAGAACHAGHWAGQRARRHVPIHGEGQDQGPSTDHSAAQAQSRRLRGAGMNTHVEIEARDYGPLRDKVRRALTSGTKEDFAQVLRETHSVGEHFVVSDEWGRFQRREGKAS